MSDIEPNDRAHCVGEGANARHGRKSIWANGAFQYRDDNQKAAAKDGRQRSRPRVAKVCSSVIFSHTGCELARDDFTGVWEQPITVKTDSDLASEFPPDSNGSFSSGARFCFELSIAVEGPDRDDVEILDAPIEVFDAFACVGKF